MSRFNERIPGKGFEVKIHNNRVSGLQSDFGASLSGFLRQPELSK